MSKTVVLTGGGTAGHVMLHIALIPEMKKRGWQIHYIGSSGIEKELIEPLAIPFFVIASGKLRRYFSIKNFFDVFRIFWGIVQSFFILRSLKPDFVFSKGGFVSVPVALAAKVQGIPVVSHESDVSLGLANRIIGKFATLIMYSFPETKQYIKGVKSLWVGTVIRPDLYQGDRKRGLSLCGFDPQSILPTVLIMGGSQGALKINQAFLVNHKIILDRFQVIHLTGSGKALNISHPHYKGFEFVRDELKDLLAAADLCVGRAGANSIFELLALNKPMLLIPLEAGSRGDQLKNAKSFVKQDWAMVLREDELEGQRLFTAVIALHEHQDQIRKAQQGALMSQSQERIFDALEAISPSTRDV
jgi:UDP-N-acetylglucosamine--N-acetylmuramyl-(pentapeptide) pyrophosphoryl-undecaprenol N-acetylglucosamine transferase